MKTKKRILLIDVQTGISDIIQANVGSDETEVLTANTPLDGIDLAYSLCPDIIILDTIRKSDMDGYYLLKSFKEEPPKSNPGIILFLAQKTTEEFRQAIDMGAETCFTIPLDAKKLCAQINNMLRKRKNSKYE